jgi:hypothetical protein
LPRRGEGQGLLFELHTPFDLEGHAGGHRLILRHAYSSTISLPLIALPVLDLGVRA